MKRVFTILLLILLVSSLSAQQYFNKSLHYTRNGKVTFYSKDNGGFEALTNIPIEELGCTKCHGATNADGVAYPENYTPGCTDCHPSNSGFSKDSLQVAQCLSCHGRQNTVINKMKLPDVHRDAGMKCWDCHPGSDMHGIETEVNSLFENGAIQAKCENCHIDENSTPQFPDHSKYDPHSGKLDCSACHVKQVIACYNCHFESMTESHLKRAYKPINNFVLLVNKDDGKVHTATFQSLEYKDTTFTAFGPGISHTIGEGRKCEECHDNANVQEYKNTGQIVFSEWNENDSILTWKTGVVPIPPDYETSFKMEFIKYLGNTSDPVAPSKNWGKVGKNTWDKVQMLYATPLTADQMSKLYLHIVADVKDEGGLPTGFKFEQNYPNPFNPSTKIEYSIPEKSKVAIEIFNSLGEKVKTLFNGIQNSGNYSVIFDGNELTSGVYFCKLSTGKFTKTIKMLLLK